MDAPFKKNATYADLYTIPETWIGEIIHGDLYAFPRARTVHARALTQLIRALGPKREIYAKGGVGHIWFADPATRSIDVFALERKSYKFVQSAGGDEKIALAPFPHSIDLAKLWKR